MAGYSTGKRRSRKADERPAKPYDEFPMYAHPSGYWAKKSNRPTAVGHFRPKFSELGGLQIRDRTIPTISVPLQKSKLLARG